MWRETLGRRHQKAIPQSLLSSQAVGELPVLTLVLKMVKKLPTVRLTSIGTVHSKLQAAPQRLRLPLSITLGMRQMRAVRDSTGSDIQRILTRQKQTLKNKISLFIKEYVDFHPQCINQQMRLNTQPAGLKAVCEPAHHSFRKPPEVISSQGGKAFSSSFQNLSLEPLSSVAFESVVKQNTGGKEAANIMTVKKHRGRVSQSQQISINTIPQ